jgi:hypothetical protein
LTNSTRTETGYRNGSADLPPGTYLVPVNLEYPGAIRACTQAMNHIQAPGGNYTAISKFAIFDMQGVTPTTLTSTKEFEMK